MKQLIYISLVIAGLCVFGCKKENKPAPAVPGVGGPYVMPALVLNSYPNATGNKWVYHFDYYVENSYNNVTSTYTASYNYTVTVIRDTILPNYSKGKVWSVASDSVTYNHIAYRDTVDHLFKVYDIPNHNSLLISITLKFPLDSTHQQTWLNSGLSYYTDTSRVTGQELYHNQPAIKISRGNYSDKGSYDYRVGVKGMAYSIFERFEVVNNQLTWSRYENTLLSTNF